MKIIYKYLLKFWPIIFIFVFWFVFAFPYLFQNVTVLPTNYLVNFFSPWNAYPGFAGPVKNGAMPDILTQIYPWKVFTIDTLKTGQIPFWNPYSFSGTVHLANYQSAALTPFNLLFFILPFITAWNLLVLLQPLLAGLFMYLYIKSLKLSDSSSAISSIAFMFCGFLTTWMAYGTLGYAILYLPLALFAIEKFYETKTYKYLILLSFTFPLSFFSGHFQISLYFALFTFAYLVFKSLIVKNTKYLFYTLLYFAVGILFTLPQVLPSIESYTQSLRSSIFIKAEIIPWGYLATFLAPDFYGNPVTRNDWFGHYAEWNTYIGLIPLMLGIYALTLIKKNKYILFFLITSVLTVLLAFQSPVIDLLIYLKIPVLSTSAASRIIVLFSFSLAVLSGFGFDKLYNDLKQKNLPPIIGSILLFGIFFSILWLTVTLKLFLPLEKITVARQNLILPTALFLGLVVLVFGSLASTFLKKGSLIKFFALVLILLVVFDMYRFAVKWMPKDPQKLIYPSVPVDKQFTNLSGYERFLGNLGGEASVYYKLQSLEGYDAVYNQRYGEFIASLKTGGFEESARSVVSFPKNGLYAKKGIDLLGVKYIIHKISDDHAVWAFPFWNYKPGDFSLIYNDGVYQILQNNNVFPRAFLVNKYTVQKDPRQILLTMFSKGFDLKNELVLEQNPNQKSGGTGKADIVKYTPNKVLVRTKSTGSSLLFLSDSYYPGWHAYVDGKEVNIYRADFTFRAINIPGGEHLVEFVYFPLSFLLGVLGSLLGLFVILGVYARKIILRTRI